MISQVVMINLNLKFFEANDILLLLEFKFGSVKEKL